jgi:hypothetical protein
LTEDPVRLVDLLVVDVLSCDLESEILERDLLSSLLSDDEVRVGVLVVEILSVLRVLLPSFETRSLVLESDTRVEDLSPSRVLPSARVVRVVPSPRLVLAVVLPDAFVPVDAFIASPGRRTERCPSDTRDSRRP